MAISGGQLAQLRDAVGKLFDMAKDQDWSKDLSDTELKWGLLKGLVAFVESATGSTIAWVLPAYKASYELASWWHTTPARERTALRCYDWLGARSKMTDKQRKIAFMVFLYVTGSTWFDSFGVGLAAPDTTWDSFLSLWDWGWLEGYVANPVVPDFTEAAAATGPSSSSDLKGRSPGGRFMWGADTGAAAPGALARSPLVWFAVAGAAVLLLRG
jgi:hypothetical protein